MGMKEILEAKRAAALAAEGKKEATPAPVQTEEPKAEPKAADILEAMGIIGTDPAPVFFSPEGPPKPMTFAEKMAAKKAAAAAPTEATEKNAVASISQRIAVTAEQLAPPTLSAEQQEVVDNAENSELAQAYTDIAMRLNSLAKTSDESDLKHSMTELKKALHKNPSVALLVLDSDIGQMVIALRKLTQTELSEASAPKKAGAPKKKQVLLTAEETAAAWDEL